MLNAATHFLFFPLVTTSLTAATPKQLFPYQEEGVKRLVEGKRILLADEPGLGKTVQCIAAINKLNLPDPKILIVCPKSVLGVWEDELQTWLNTDTASLDIRVVTAQDFQIPPDGSITLINYDICHKLQDSLQSIHFDVMICDEAHYLKSRAAKRTQAVLGNGKKNKGIQADFLWLLTGTPILNRPVELFPLLQAMDPDEIGSFAAYAERYCEPKAIPRGRLVVMDYSGASNLVELSKRLEPRMVRRYKSDVLTQLPPKFRSCLCLTGAEDAKKQERKMLMALMENDELNSNDGNLEDFGAEATSLMNYLGTKTNLDLEDPDNRNRIMGTLATIRKETALNKLAPAVELLENVILSQKVVVFCHHRELIARLLETFGKQAVSIVGGMDRESRSDAVRRFQQDDSVRMFVGSIHAAGVGLTLTAASRVVFLELDWSPAVMSQAEDRCHRVGQTDSVQVQYYVFKDTIDEWVARSLLSKQSNIDQILPEAISSQTGYVFDFGKYNEMRLEDVPRTYLTYLVKKEIFKTRPSLWKALVHRGMVLEQPPPEATKAAKKQEDSVADVEFTFDFGKHKGLRWGDTPQNYREWIMREGVWKTRPTLSKALSAAGLMEQPNESSNDHVNNIDEVEKRDNTPIEWEIPDVPF
jgi:SWI/SNF-related matrix-associated actin-dependent regulator of chromatin subfamily A-like protein 1